MGEIGEHLTIRSICIKVYVGLVFQKKKTKKESKRKREGVKENNDEKNEKRKNKKSECKNQKKKRHKVRKEGSEDEPANLHKSKGHMCACLQAMALHFSKKTFDRLASPNLALMRACKASP